jgi:prefoldin subunit 5
MTAEDMERAIEFLLKSQATLEGQIAETNRIVQMHAESQTQFIEIVSRTLEALGDSQRKTDARLADAYAGHTRRADETDARLDRLVGVVEKLAVGRNGS